MSHASDLDDRRQQLRRLGYSYYLRTGRVPMEIKSALGEDISGGYWVKFNPYHDPENGRFTFAPGHPNAIGNAVISDRRNAVKPARRNAANTKPPSSSDQIPSVPYLSSAHNEVRKLAAKYPPATGTNEWTPDDLVAWVAGGKSIFEFKDQWVHGYRDAIVAAARRYDLPPELVAGTAYNEVGGDPLIVDDVAYALRGVQTRDLTSLGNVSIQVRRAAEALGYDMSQDLSLSQRRAVIASLKNPETNIFIAAKHLSDLRNIDFESTSSAQLTKRQVEAIATRYNRGPDLSLSEIEKNTDYGQDITKRWGHLRQLIQ